VLWRKTCLLLGTPAVGRGATCAVYSCQHVGVEDGSQTACPSPPEERIVRCKELE
jgi:hypothetical protein